MSQNKKRKSNNTSRHAISSLTIDLAKTKNEDELKADCTVTTTSDAQSELLQEVLSEIGGEFMSTLADNLLLVGTVQRLCDIDSITLNIEGFSWRLKAKELDG